MRRSLRLGCGAARKHRHTPVRKAPASAGSARAGPANPRPKRSPHPPSRARQSPPSLPPLSRNCGKATNSESVRPLHAAPAKAQGFRQPTHRPPKARSFHTAHKVSQTGRQGVKTTPRAPPAHYTAGSSIQSSSFFVSPFCRIRGLPVLS